MLIFALAMDFFRVGEMELNQLTVAQFMGGVGGAIAVGFIAATLYLQQRALEEAQRISQMSHQFEAYSLWRDIDESIDDSMTSAIGNVMSALAARMIFGVDLKDRSQIDAVLQEQDQKRWNNIESCELLGSSIIHIYDNMVRITVNYHQTVDNPLINKVINSQVFSKSISINLVDTSDMLHDILFFEFIQVGNAVQERITPLAKTLGGEQLLAEDARRVRQFSSRILLHLDEAENLGCAPQCRARISKPAARMYLDVLARLGTDSQARSKIYSSLSDIARVDGGTVSAKFDDLQRWRIHSSTSLEKR